MDIGGRTSYVRNDSGSGSGRAATPATVTPSTVAAARGNPTMHDEQTEATKSIFINGARTQTGACSLADLLSENGYHAAAVATAINGEFVAAGSRSDVTIADGDHIEVVSARQGG